MHFRRDVVAISSVDIFIAIFLNTPAPAAPAPQAAAPPVATHVSIKVTDESGKPAEGVTLWLLDSFRPAYVVGDTPDAQHVLAATVTDKDGVGEINFTPKGFNQLVVVSDNFAPQHIPSPPLSPDKPFEIRLSRGQTISGTLKLEDGRPLAGATVRGTRQKAETDFLAQFHPTATSDSHGRFEMPHVAPGVYELTTSVDQPVYVEPINVDVDVNANSQPKPLDLVARPGVVLKGKFVRSGNSPPGRLPVELFIRAPKFLSRKTLSAPDGSFTVYNIPPDSRGNINFYDIEDSAQVQWPDKPQGADPGLEMLQFQGLAAGTYDGIVVKLYKPAVFQGTITDETGKPYPRASVMVMPLGRGRIADPNGHFSVNLPPGLDSTVRISNLDAQDPPAPLSFHPSEGQVIEKNFTLRRKVLATGLEMRGRVIDAHGKPVIGAVVQLGNSGVLPSDLAIGAGRPGVPKPTWTGGTSFPAQTQTDGQGNFRFDRLLPGRSDVWADVGQMQWGIVHDVDSKSSDIRIVLHDAPAGARFEGTVEDPEGRPVPNAQLLLFNGDWFRSQQLVETKTDSAGHFSLQSDLTVERCRHVRLICRDSAGHVQWKTLPKIGDVSIRLRFREEAAVTGRVTNKRGEPLAGAKVSLNSAGDPQTGYMQFYRLPESTTPFTTADSQGRFRLAHLPKGAEVSLTARHPEYLTAGTVRYPDIGPESKVPDVQMNDGVTIEGLVRLPDGKPAAGATVKVTSFDQPEISSQTDDRGAYKLTGVQSGQFKTDPRIIATLGPEWEGSPAKDEYLNSGDHVTGWDITLEKSRAVRLSEWQQHPVPPPPSKYTVALLDDADPATEGKLTFHDTLTVYDGSAKPLWQYNQLNVRYEALLAGDPTDRSVYVYETGASRLTKFSPSGALLWSQPRERINGIVVDPVSRNVLLAGAKPLMIDPDGKELPAPPAASAMTAFDPHIPSFWTIQGGQPRAVRISPDGKILSQSTFTIEFGSQLMGISVNPADGSLWFALRGQSPFRARNEIVAISEDGQLLKRFDLADDWPRSIAVDAAHNALWVAGAVNLYKLSPDGAKLATLPLAGPLCLEPDTGCLWVASPNTLYRISPDAQFIASAPTSPSYDKRICLLGG